MRRIAVIAAVIVAGGPGCAARAPVDVHKLTQRIEELAQREADKQRQIDELNNRLFLLEDKVDTNRVAAERSSARPPRLPVIRLRSKRPDDGDVRRTTARSADDEEREEGEEGEDREERAEGEEDEPEAGTGGKALIERRRVLYSGAATRQGPRPMLRLHESPSGAPAATGGTAEGLAKHGPDPAAVTEKLPLAPLPRRADVRRAAAAPADPTPMRAYSEAMTKYKSGEYSAAAEAFRMFVKRYGKHAYADNALYWLGECSYDMKNYRLALKMFRQVVEEYPDGNKAPDALLKIAYCYLRLKEQKNARTVLAQVVESFPKSPVARLASQTLAKMQ